MTMIALALIRTDGDTQSRAETDAETIESYRDAMESGAAFPPVVAFFDGRDYWLGDGFHRVWAAAAAGREDIEADIRKGTQRDAILFSAGANASHGLRRTNSDKRRAVLKLLTDHEWRKWSDRKIAGHCAVHQTTVTRMRQELSDAKHQMASKRLVERNGTVYPMSTGGINAGRRPDLPGQASFLGDEDDEGEGDDAGPLPGPSRGPARSDADEDAETWDKFLESINLLFVSLPRRKGWDGLMEKWSDSKKQTFLETLTRLVGLFNEGIRTITETLDT